MPDELHPYLQRWQLQEDGEPFATFSGWLQPVLFKGKKAMLKIGRREKDRRANELMIWWNGEGAAKVLLHDERAMLMERATGESSLTKMVMDGRDDQATRILCGVTGRLHLNGPPFPENLVPLDKWFTDLPTAAAAYGGTFAECSSVADGLLNDHRAVVALHGDIHHGNVLDFGDRCWLAIDPKGLIGDRAFDYSNIFCNPDGPTATQPGRLMRQAAVAADASGLDRTRLLRWIIAWAGLSAAWCIIDGGDPNHALGVAGIALAAL